MMGVQQDIPFLRNYSAGNEKAETLPHCHKRISQKCGLFDGVSNEAMFQGVIGNIQAERDKSRKVS